MSPLEGELDAALASLFRGRWKNEMGQRKYPPLTPSEVVDILGALGFRFKRQEGSHAHHERDKDANRPRSIVTVDLAETEFGDFLVKIMIAQSNFSRDEFYGATKKTAKKAGVKSM